MAKFKRMCSTCLIAVCLLASLLRLEAKEESVQLQDYVSNYTHLCSELRQWVTCTYDQLTPKVYLARGLCITFDSDTGKTEIGKCPYTIFEKNHDSMLPNGFIELPENVSNLNEFMCGSWNREGYLCSKCKDGYGLAIPNVYMKCMECKFKDGESWLFYFLLQLVPVVILFLVVLVFRISIVKPPLNAYVTFCQISLVTLFVHSYRFLSPYVSDSPALKQAHYLSMVSMGVWAMSLTGLIRGVGLTDFCVSHSVNIQQAFILTQIKSLFPLVLITITYVCIKLHNRKYKLILWLWKPFHRCLAHLSSTTEMWNSNLSLVDVFSTFLLLSYSRYIIVLYFMYSFQHIYTVGSGWNGTPRLLYNPAVTYFNTAEHLPYAVVLMFTLLIVGIPPVLLLAFYQTRCFHRVLSCFRVQRTLSIFIFVDLSQGSYKNSLNGGCDLRFTASLYLILRIAVLLTYVGCNSTKFVSCDTVLMFLWVFLLLLFFALVRPYKDQRMNILDSLMMAGLALINLLLCSTSQNFENKTLNLFVLSLVLVIVAIPQLVLFVYLFYKVCRYLTKLQCSRRYFERVSSRQLRNIVSSSVSDQEKLWESLPDRVDNPYNYCND